MFDSIKAIINNNNFLIKYILEYKKWIILIVILDLVGSSFLMALPIVAKYLIDTIIIDKQYETFKLMLTTIIIIAILSGITQYATSFYKINLSGKLFVEKSQIYLPKAINANKI